MKKIFILIIVCILSLSSCTTNTTNTADVQIIENDKGVICNEVQYVEYNEISWFEPFVSDHYSGERNAYDLSEEFSADEKDVNLNYIYLSSGILGGQVYQKEGTEVPHTIDDFSKIDRVFVWDEKTHKLYAVKNEYDIEVLLDYFTSEDFLSINSSPNPGRSNSHGIYIFAQSDYYGGEYNLLKNTSISWDTKMILHDAYETELPQDVITAISNAIS